jgi:hypothetical protein
MANSVGSRRRDNACQRLRGDYYAPARKKRVAARRCGGMAEWLMALAWKACIRETVSWVRIPLPPPGPLSTDVRRYSPEFADGSINGCATAFSIYQFVLPCSLTPVDD